MNIDKTKATVILSVALALAVAAFWRFGNSGPRQSYEAPSPEGLLATQPTTSSTQAQFEAYVTTLKARAVPSREVSFTECRPSPAVASISPADTVTIKNASGPIVSMTIGNKPVSLRYGAETTFKGSDLLGALSPKGFSFAVFGYSCSRKLDAIAFVSLK